MHSEQLVIFSVQQPMCNAYACKITVTNFSLLCDNVIFIIAKSKWSRSIFIANWSLIYWLLITFKRFSVEPTIVRSFLIDFEQFLVWIWKILTVSITFDCHHLDRVWHFKLVALLFFVTDVVPLFAEMHYLRKRKRNHRPSVESMGSRFRSCLPIVCFDSIVWIDVLVMERRAPDTLNYCSTQNTKNINCIHNGWTWNGHSVFFFTGNILFTLFILNSMLTLPHENIIIKKGALATLFELH